MTQRIRKIKFHFSPRSNWFRVPRRQVLFAADAFCALHRFTSSSSSYAPSDAIVSTAKHGLHLTPVSYPRKSLTFFNKLWVNTGLFVLYFRLSIIHKIRKEFLCLEDSNLERQSSRLDRWPPDHWLFEGIFKNIILLTIRISLVKPLCASLTRRWNLK